MDSTVDVDQGDPAVRLIITIAAGISHTIDAG